MRAQHGQDAADGGRVLPGRRPGAGLLRLVVLVALLLSMVALRSWVLDPVRVSSESMAPTLHRNHVVVVQKLGHGSPARGQVVAFRAPVDGVLTVKRVVGLPGDEVEIRDAVLHVNDRPVQEPAVDHAQINGLFFGPARVPAGSVFVMGDNRLNSVDSRNYGPVPVDRVAGRVDVRVWPPARVE
jgi:signal peptidase I